MPHERTMQEALLEAGWPSGFLRWDQRAARIDERNGKTVFVPWSRRRRLLNWFSQHESVKYLPVCRVIGPGVQIRFDPILARDRMFLGLVDPPQIGMDIASQFPFGQLLTVGRMQRFGFEALDPTSRILWMVSHVALTLLLEVSISTLNNNEE